jgi:death on curing protein
MVEYLDLEDLLAIAADATGGHVAVRDHGLLVSVLARPRASVFGQDAYPDPHVKAAALLHSLYVNHALVDGNKRLAWLATYVFLDINGHTMVTDQRSVVELVMSVADGSLADLEKIADKLRRWSVTGPVPPPRSSR